MTRPEHERQFLAFQATGDPRAIAEVYDELAPELLLVAAHVGHRGGDAEDLVQATFLAAMEQAESFDGERPLLPWLIGILVNQARREQRRRGRRPDPDRLSAPRAPADPAQAAETAELADELARKLRALPEYYRQVLTLRFVHGLSPTDIAHSLGLSPATVKTRLRRGQEILRQALPAGLVASLALLATTQRGVAEMRAAIVEHAERLLVARRAAAAPAAGTWLALAVGVLAAAGAAFALWPPGDEPSGLPRAEPGAATAAGGERAAIAEPARHEVAPAEPGPAPAGSRLRVVWHDGSPAPGVAVVASPLAGSDPLLHERWLRSAADGTVELRAGEHGWRLAALRGGAVDLGAAGEAAELVIPRGIDLAGRVVDGDTPVAGAELHVAREGFADECHLAVTTDEAGRFALRSLAPGRAFTVIAEGFAPRPLERADGEPGERVEATIDLAPFRSAWSIEGRVVDADGGAVAGAVVQLGRRLPYLDFADEALGPDSRRPPLTLRTDDDGRFRREGLVLFQRQLDLWVRAPGFAAAHRAVPFHGLSAEVEIALEPGRGVRGRATCGDGRPAAGAVIATRAADGDLWAFAPRWAEASDVAAADGRFELRGVPLGAVRLAATAAGGRRATTVLAEEGDARWDPVLLEPGAIEGIVVDETGGPIAGALVVALVAAGRTRPPQATTGADGRFTVPDCDRVPHSLWITDPGTPWSGAIATVPALTPPVATLRVVVPPRRIATSAITGRVVDEHGAPLAARLQLTNLHPGAAHAQTDPATGVFRFEPVPALDAPYELYAHVALDRWAQRLAIAVEGGSTVDLGDLVVASAHRVRLRVEHDDGRPVARAVAVIAPRGGVPFDRCEVADGAGISTPLAPGRYVLHLEGAGLPLAATELEVEGEDLALTVRVGPGHPRRFELDHEDDGYDLRLDLVWCDTAGRELCRDRVQLPHDRPLAIERSFAPGAWLLRATAHSGRTVEIPFTAGDPTAAAVAVGLR